MNDDIHTSDEMSFTLPPRLAPPRKVRDPEGEIVVTYSFTHTTYGKIETLHKSRDWIQRMIRMVLQEPKLKLGMEIRQRTFNGSDEIHYPVGEPPPVDEEVASDLCGVCNLHLIERRFRNKTPGLDYVLEMCIPCSEWYLAEQGQLGRRNQIEELDLP